VTQGTVLALRGIDATNRDKLRYVPLRHPTCTQEACGAGSHSSVAQSHGLSSPMMIERRAARRPDPLSFK
jgi:hypothetical protein